MSVQKHETASLIALNKATNYILVSCWYKHLIQIIPINPILVLIIDFFNGRRVLEIRHCKEVCWLF